MGQSWTDNCYQIDHNGVTDLAVFENNFNCLKSNFSGVAAPSSPVAGQRWYDNTHKLQRCYINSSWVVLMPGDADQKIWTYCNSCPEGMVTVSMVDKVLAIKGGSGNYNISGGNTGGSWSWSHTHGAGSFTVNTYHKHNVGAYENVYNDNWTFLSNEVCTDYQGSTTQPVAGTSATEGTASTWRPSGSIGILIRPDM